MYSSRERRHKEVVDTKANLEATVLMYIQDPLKML
jgi:hypothetical protein